MRKSPDVNVGGGDLRYIRWSRPHLQENKISPRSVRFSACSDLLARSWRGRASGNSSIYTDGVIISAMVKNGEKFL